MSAVWGYHLRGSHDDKDDGQLANSGGGVGGESWMDVGEGGEEEGGGVGDLRRRRLRRAEARTKMRTAALEIVGDDDVVGQR